MIRVVWRIFGQEEATVRQVGCHSLETEFACGCKFLWEFDGRGHLTPEENAKRDFDEGAFHCNFCRGGQLMSIAIGDFDPMDCRFKQLTAIKRCIPHSCL